MLDSGNNVVHLLETHLPPALLTITHAITSVSTRTTTNAYIVGGAVRDLCLSHPVHDLDIITEGDSRAFGLELAKALAGTIKAVSQFGTVKLDLLGHYVDIAEARKEHYPYPGALPRVKPANIHTDLLRRDFTINAMAISLQQSSLGALVTVERSADDIAGKVIRVLHRQSFQDDATRLMRAVRYEQRFEFRLEKETEALARQNASMIATISGDRVRKEITIMLQESNKANCLKRLDNLSVLDKIHPTLSLTDEAYQALRNAPLETPAMTLWAILAHRCEAKDLDSLNQRLNLPRSWNHTILDVIAVSQVLDRLDDPTLRSSEVYWLLFGLGTHAIKAWSLLKPATTSGAWLDYYLKKLRMAKTKLTGNDLIELGIPKGPQIGILLKELLDGRLDGTLSSRKDEVRYLNEKQQ